MLRGPIPRQEFNPGTADRFLRGDLVDVVDLPSPYKVHKGANIQFFKINDAGREAAKDVG